MNGERSFALREISIFFCPAEEREKRKGKEFIITPVLPRLKSHWNAAEEKGERWLSLVIIRPPMKEECNDNFLLFSPAIRNSSLFSLVISLEIGKNLNESVAIWGASANFLRYLFLILYLNMPRKWNRFPSEDIYTLQYFRHVTQATFNCFSANDTSLLRLTFSPYAFNRVVKDFFFFLQMLAFRLAIWCHDRKFQWGGRRITKRKYFTIVLTHKKERGKSEAE